MGKCLEELEETHVQLTRWMSEMEDGMTIDKLFSQLHYSEDFLLDMRQRQEFGYVAGLKDVKGTLSKLQGGARGLRLVLKDVRVEYQSKQKVIILFDEYQVVEKSIGNIVHSRIHCRPKQRSSTEIEFYLQEESDMPYA